MEFFQSLCLQVFFWLWPFCNVVAPVCAREPPLTGATAESRPENGGYIHVFVVLVVLARPRPGHDEAFRETIRVDAVVLQDTLDA